MTVWTVATLSIDKTTELAVIRMTKRCKGVAKGHLSLGISHPTL
jgi:hypothetical protein